MVGLMLLPLAPLVFPARPVTPFIAVNMILFALLNSGLAFLLDYRLIADIAPTKVLTVSVLMPEFRTIWAALFLGEVVTTPMIVGCTLILGGTVLVVVRR